MSATSTRQPATKDSRRTIEIDADYRNAARAVDWLSNRGFMDWPRLERAIARLNDGPDESPASGVTVPPTICRTLHEAQQVALGRLSVARGPVVPQFVITPQADGTYAVCRD